MRPTQSIADTSRALRATKGMSQRDLAAAAGVSQPVVNRWEKHGTLDRQMAEMTKLAKGLGISVCVLIGCEDAA